MEVFITVISGVSVYVLGQFTLKLIIEPIQEFKKEIAEIINVIGFHANITSNPNMIDQEQSSEISKILRKHAINLESKSSIIPFYKMFENIRLLPKNENIEKASSELIGLSNSLYSSINGFENYEKSSKIKKYLKI